MAQDRRRWTYAWVYGLVEQSGVVTWRHERGQNKDMKHMRRENEMTGWLDDGMWLIDWCLLVCVCVCASKCRYKHAGARVSSACQWVNILLSESREGGWFKTCRPQNEIPRVTSIDLHVFQSYSRCCTAVLTVGSPIICTLLKQFSLWEHTESEVCTRASTAVSINVLHGVFWAHFMCAPVCMCSLGRCVSSLKNLFFMLANWWLEWCEGGWGGGGSLSFPSSSAARRNRALSMVTNRIAALWSQRRSDNKRSATLCPPDQLWRR